MLMKMTHDDDGDDVVIGDSDDNSDGDDRDV